MNFKIRIVQLYILIKYYLTVIYVLIFRKKSKDVWLISERGDDARDNGYAFFLYLKHNHPNINTKYVISRKSYDLNKLENYKNDIIYYRSFKHCLYFILSKILISTHIMGFSPEFRSFGKLLRKKLIYFKGKQVFLQHGITKDDSPGLYKEKTYLDLFICGAQPEFDYISNGFNYKNNEVKYTGFARFDYLKNTINRTILLMPTWRENLYKLGDDDFIKSEYYKTYQKLINNYNLSEILKKYNYKLIFYPHYEIQKRINIFHTKYNNIIIAKSKDYGVSDLLKSTNLLITDFSSVFFDVAYLKKPIIYYQFDYEEYRKSHYREGYFSYLKDGFGPVVKNQDELLKIINNYFNNDFEVEKKYLDRIKNFFTYEDNNNCLRIYNEILKIQNKDGD